jgi:hypothetical protein
VRKTMTRRSLHKYDWFLTFLRCGCLSLLLPTVVIGCAMSTRDDGSVGRARAVAWQVSSTQGASVSIGLTVPYCQFRRKPRIRHIKVDESSKTAVITVVVAFPRHDAKGNCFGVQLLLGRKIRLEHPVSTLKLYDGSRSPPALRWPRR